MAASPFRFPMDLERDIFELAAREHPGCAVRLALVAHRVLIWIEPIIYEIVMLEEPPKPATRSFLRTFRARPPSFFAKHVKHLGLHDQTLEDGDVERLLTVCTGVVNLAYWSGSDSIRVPRLISHRSITRLSIPPGDLFDQGSILDMSRPLFTSLTHIDIAFMDDHWERLAQLAKIPTLTHLAFNDDIITELVDSVLAECKLLRVLAIIWHGGDSSFPDLEDIHDPRVAVVHSGNDVEDWKRGARGESDFWMRAEEIVAKRARDAGGPSDHP